MSVIDSHLHLWELGAGGYGWLDGITGPLHASFTAAAARAELDAAGVDGAILVQADDTADDTAFLLATADTNDWVMGVVGWVPIDDGARAAALLDRWADHPRFCGVRQLLHDDPRDGLLLTSDGRSLASMLAARGLPLDIPDGFPRLLADATALAASEDGLTVVIDHLGKPPASTEGFERWRAELAAAAALPNTVAKVSGLSTADRPFAAADARRAWEVALDAFGPHRLMLGGDWPITITSGGYVPVWSGLSELVDELSLAEQQSLRGGTAAAVYRLAPLGGHRA
ncbi:amidohydrolase family protein [Plantibacter flavus]|uniref:amidohydrolase family protein n=1 Tax=Plantibacter flavus TaxID=150123 RepID=UPI003F13A38F